MEHLKSIKSMLFGKANKASRRRSSSAPECSNNNNNNNNNNHHNKEPESPTTWFSEDSLLLIELPNEVITHILTFLDANHIRGPLQLVNWSLNRLCHENRLWKKIARKTWNVKEKLTCNWRSYHILKTQLQSDGAIEWQKIPPMGVRPSKRYQNSSTTVGNKIYLIGGQETATNRFNEIFEFDTEKYTFLRVAVKGTSQPPSFARHVAVAIGTKIYVHGGFDGHGTYFGVSVFDTVANTWSYVDTKGEKPSPRTNHAAAAIGKYVYIYGGIKRSTADNSVLEDLGDMFVLDTETFVWREEHCANMPPPRCGHKMLAMRGKLYLFGGGAGEDWAQIYNDINVYDPELKKWTQIQCEGAADTSTFSCMFAMDPFIFIFGGQYKTKKDCSPIVYCYDSIAHSWQIAQPVSSKPEARDMATMSVVRSAQTGQQSAFLFGGYNQKCFDDVYLMRLTKAANNALETLVISEEYQDFSPASSPPSSPYPSSSARNGLAVSNDDGEDEY